MTKSIDDRAVAWSEKHRDIYMCNADVIAELSYKQGAIEQKAIDDEEYRKDMRYINIRKQELIDKACEWLSSCNSLLMKPYNIKLFRKAMEE